MSTIHALIALSLACISVWGVCDDPKDSIFTSDACIMKPKAVQVYLVAISSAYCVYDLYVCLFCIKYTWKQGADFIFHHIVGLIGAVGVLIVGRFNVALSCGALVSELSNFFMNMRWHMLQHKMTTSPLFNVAQMSFAFSFFVVRVVFMLMLVVRNWQIHSKFDIWA